MLELNKLAERLNPHCLHVLEKAADIVLEVVLDRPLEKHDEPLGQTVKLHVLEPERERRLQNVRVREELQVHRVVQKKFGLGDLATHREKALSVLHQISADRQRVQLLASLREPDRCKEFLFQLQKFVGLVPALASSEFEAFLMGVEVAPGSQVLEDRPHIRLELEAQRGELRHGNLLVFAALLLHLAQGPNQVFVDD